MGNKECIICGHPSADPHHLIMGSNRTIADADNLILPICRICHTKIHNDARIERKSKELGQLLFEFKKMITSGESEESAKRIFLERYGRNFL